MSAFLVLRPLMEIVPPLRLLDGTHVELLQAVPLCASEVAFKSHHQAEDLWKLWRTANVPLWNPDRSAEPAVTA
jgi:hypothetical protein